MNGNVLAARSFISSLLSSLVSSNPSLTSSLSTAPIPVGESSELILTTDPTLNWAQLAVLTCQRAQGAQSKPVREAWVRLCGTYQSKGGMLADPAVRQALQDISTLYFAIPAPRQQAANPFGDMFSSLLGGPPSGGGSQAPRKLAPPKAIAPDVGGLD